MELQRLKDRQQRRAAFERDWETPSRPLAYLEMGTTERFYEAEINTTNCNILGWSAAPSRGQASNISEENITAIFRVNKSSAILNSRNAGISTPHYTPHCTPHYTPHCTPNKTKMLIFTGLVGRVMSVFCTSQYVLCRLNHAARYATPGRYTWTQFLLQLSRLFCILLRSSFRWNSE